MGQTKLIAQLSLGDLKGIGPLGGENEYLGNVFNAGGAFVAVFSTVIGLLTVIAIIWFVFVFFTGAISWLASGGDKTKTQNAQKQITNGIIGLILVISALFIITAIGEIAGIDITNMVNFIIKLGPPSAPILPDYFDQ